MTLRPKGPAQRASRKRGLSRGLRDRMENCTVFSPSWWNTARFDTVRRNRGAFWGIAELPMAVPGGLLSRRCILVAVLAARSLITNRHGKGSLAAGCVRGILCVQNRGFSVRLRQKPYGKPTGDGAGWQNPWELPVRSTPCRTNCRSPALLERFLPTWYNQPAVGCSTKDMQGSIRSTLRRAGISPGAGDDQVDSIEGQLRLVD